MKKNKIIISCLGLVFCLSCIIGMTSGLPALSVKQNMGANPFTNLGSFTPGERKYWQPEAGLGFTIENNSGSTTSVRVDIMNRNTSPIGLALETNPSYYIECSGSKPNFVYHAKG